MGATVVQITIDGNNITAIKSIDGVETKLKGLDNTAKKTGGSLSNLFGDANKALGMLGVGLTVGAIGMFIKDAVVLSAEMEVLTANFKGGTAGLELFRKATAGTVSDANLIKLSNQASDLGLSVKQQAMLMSLAEDAADKYGGTVEDNFSKVLNASEGATKGLKMVGIQKAVYDEIVKRYVRGYGAEQITQLDSETQKWIQVEAMIEATGVTLEDVTGKTKDAKDKIESLSVGLENLKTSFGSLALRGFEDFFKFLYAAVDEGGNLLLAHARVFAERLGADLQANQQKTFREGIAFATGFAEDEILNKSKAQIQRIFKGQQDYVDQLKAKGKPTTFDDKLTLAKALAEMDVYEAAANRGKKSADAAASQAKKLKEEEASFLKQWNDSIYKSSLEGLDDLTKGFLEAERKYDEGRKRFGYKPLFEAKYLEDKISVIDSIYAKMGTNVISMDDLMTQAMHENSLKRIAGIEDEIGKTMALWLEGFEYEGDLVTQAIQRDYDKLTIQAAIFGSMSDIAYIFYSTGGQMAETAFRAYQAFSVAQAIISTYAAAAAALAPPPIGAGPVLGPWLAASVIAQGLVRVGAIIATRPNLGGGMSSGGGGGYSASSMPNPSTIQNNSTTNTNVKTAPTVIININGDVLDVEKWMRKNSGALNRAIKDGLIDFENN